jgi:hypothetical protein
LKFILISLLICFFGIWLFRSIYSVQYLGFFQIFLCNWFIFYFH